MGMVKILIVDDDQQNIRIVESFLKRKQIDVITAGDGKEALEIAEKKKPDLVVSDILMPVMDGFTFCRSWKKNPKLNSIPFVFYTATYTDSKDETYAMSLGAAKFLRKPMPLNAFVDQIQAVLTSAGKGEEPAAVPQIEDKEEHYKQYSERLVRKLEKKLLDLENEVSVRKQISERLHQSQHEWEEMFQAIGDPIQIIDSDFTIVKANHATRKVMRNPEADLVGKKCYELFHRTNHPAGGCPLAGIKAGQKVVMEEVEIEALNGSYIVSCTPIYNRSGAFEKAIHMMIDITPRVESRQAMLRMKRLLNDAQELGKVGAWEFDLAREFCYWTDNMHRLLGYEPGEIVDKYQFFFDNVVHPDDRARISDLFQRLIKDKKPRSAQYRVLHKNGHHLVFHGVMAPVLDNEGRLERIYGTSVDISEQKRMDDERRKLEEQLLKAQKLESVGALAGGIAHDFNNILSAVIGYSELAWEQGGDAGAVRESLTEVLQASRRAKDLVSQILAFSRQIDHEFAPVQIRLIVTEVCKLLRATLPSNITVETDIHSAASILADAGQIHQVLMNLCTNAYQAMNAMGGVITLKIDEIELGQSPGGIPSDLKPGKYLELVVQDNGGGMDEATMNRIFDPYFSTKRPEEGTGLGLAVVFGIVKSHGGCIDVESKIDQGSTFRILFPAIKTTATDRKEDNPAFAERGNERILFVDDELLLAKLAKQMLESLGYHVLAKTNSVEALESFHASPDDYDLIITDMMMPHMTGECLAREVTKIRPEIPMIICTGFSERIDRKEARELGFKAFVRKPWRKAEMAGAIRKALAN
jgi:PAS domain S-box-containing protein